MKAGLLEVDAAEKEVEEEPPEEEEEPPEVHLVPEIVEPEVYRHNFSRGVTSL